MQDRQEWLKWRHQGIGSSDAPIIMGRSPYKTRLKLYAEKILPEPPNEEPNFIQEKGNRKEPIARKHFAAMRAIETGVDDPFEPRLFHIEEMPFIKASLDGVSKDGKEFIEIKFVGKDEFQNLKEVPERYVDQVQHQYMASGCERCFFVLIDEDDRVRYFEAPADEERQSELLAAETVFWIDHVVAKKEPEAGPGDYKELRFRGAAAAAQKFKKLKREQEEVEAQLEALRETILSYCTHPRMTLRGMKLIQVERKGNVDYAKIPELKGVDLEQYRKAGGKSWQIRI